MDVTFSLLLLLLLCRIVFLLLDAVPAAQALNIVGSEEEAPDGLTTTNQNMAPEREREETSSRMSRVT